MKKALTMTISILISLVYSFTYAQYESGFFITLKRDSSNEMKHKDDGIMRSPSILPATVVFDGMSITVNFVVPISKVTIKITNTDSGEILYSEVYTSPNCVNVPLNIASDIDMGYRIDLISDSWTLYGEFVQ